MSGGHLSQYVRLHERALAVRKTDLRQAQDRLRRVGLPKGVGIRGWGTFAKATVSEREQLFFLGREGLKFRAAVGGPSRFSHRSFSRDE